MSDDMKVHLSFPAWEADTDIFIDRNPFHGWRWGFADAVYDVGVRPLL